MFLIIFKTVLIITITIISIIWLVIAVKEKEQ